jgi:predicted ATPase with chaperone activity
MCKKERCAPAADAAVYLLKKCSDRARWCQTRATFIWRATIQLFKKGRVRLQTATFFPREPQTVEETGLSLGAIVDLIVKTLYYSSEAPGHQIAEMVGLPFTNVLERAFDSLKNQKAVDVAGATGLGAAGYRYYLTDRGRQLGREALERSAYTGKAPVPIAAYCDAVNAQSTREAAITQEQLQQTFAGMVLSNDLLIQLGPAVNSGRSLLLFGAPGDGKTTIAERIASLLGSDVWLPEATEVDGHVIKLFDPGTHRISPVEQTRLNRADGRWVHCKRPVVISGGELTLDALDLRYSPTARFYEAPHQMRASGGMFLIDDFGRQQVSPRDLLNRWIVPLEKRIDYLTLHTGKKVAIPFDELIVFSTNLDPGDLVDEAFLRRIRYKVFVRSPTPEQYREIFRRMCRQRGVEYVDAAVSYLLQERYARHGIPLRACHPRDLLDQVVDTARYLNIPPVMSKQLLDVACDSYFVVTAPANPIPLVVKVP